MKNCKSISKMSWRCGADGVTRSIQQGGSAVLVFIVLLAIMVVLITANSKALFYLKRETKLIEQKQIQRLNSAQTNAPAIVQPSPGTE